jgi:hypothetical protein
VSWASTLAPAMAALSVMCRTIELDGEVRDGPAVGDEAAREVITIGYIGPDDDNSAEATFGAEDLGSAVAQENYDIHCAAAVLNGDEDVPAVRARVAALMNAVGDLLAQDIKLRGTVAKAEISSWSLREDMTTGGAYARIRFDVSVTAFTQR